jgi:hypothetical protein
MNKQLIVVSFSTCMLLAYTSYSQSDVIPEEEQIQFIIKDSIAIPTDTAFIQKNSLKGKLSSYYRYKDLAKEKERRKKIRAQYQKEKLLKK